MNITYDTLKAEYLDSITKLDKICFTLCWSRALFESELRSSNAYYIVAMDCGEVVGYCGLQSVVGEGSITNIAVLPEYRNKGIASTLLKKIIAYGIDNGLEFITLEVRESNINAIKLYEKYGFGEVGRRKNYYSDNKETAILMTKYL